MPRFTTTRYDAVSGIPARLLGEHLTALTQRPAKLIERLWPYTVVPHDLGLTDRVELSEPPPICMC